MGKYELTNPHLAPLRMVSITSHYAVNGGCFRHREGKCPALGHKVNQNQWPRLALESSWCSFIQLCWSDSLTDTWCVHMQSWTGRMVCGYNTVISIGKSGFSSQFCHGLPGWPWNSLWLYFQNRDNLVSRCFHNECTRKPLPVLNPSLLSRCVEA